MSAHVDELETAIKEFLRSGKLKVSARRNLSKRDAKDLKKGLTRNLPIEHCNRITKSFLIVEAKLLNRDFKEKSGCWYRLNRWREEQITANKKITYGDLAKQLVQLCNVEDLAKKFHTDVTLIFWLSF